MSTEPDEQTLTEPDPRPDAGRGRLERLVPVLVSTVLALGSAALAVLLRSTIHPGDPRSYLVVGARTLPESTWNAAGYSRYGITLLVWPFERLWGVSQAAEYAVPVLVTAWLSVALYLLGRRLWGDVAGVAAAVLVVLNPVYFITTTRIYPDNVSAPILVTAFLLILVVGDEWRRETARQARVTRLLVWIGFLVGWSWATRETAVVVWPVLAWMLLRRVPLRRVALAVALPALGWLLLEFALNQIGHHDPLARFGILTGTYAAAPGPTTSSNFVAQTSRVYAMYVPHQWRERPELLWLLPMTAVAAIGAVLFSRRLGYLAAWVVATVALALAGGGVLRPGNVSLRLDIERYWIAFLVPITLCAVGAVAEALRWLRQRIAARSGAPALRWWPAVVAAVFVALLAYPADSFRSWAATDGELGPQAGQGMEQLRDYLARTVTEDDQVWGSSNTLRMLDLYRTGPFGGSPEWRTQLQSLTKDGHGTPAAGDYVVYLPHSTCTICVKGMRSWRPGKGERTRDWELVWKASRGDVRVYRQR